MCRARVKGDVQYWNTCLLEQSPVTYYYERKQAAEPELLAGSLGACLQSQDVGSGGRRSRSSNHMWLHSEFEASLAY